MFCKQHSIDGMINIKAKLCNEANCTKRSIFGYKNKLSEFCSEHSKFDMINLNLK